MLSTAEGNKAAFRQLLARHLPKAHAIARRVLKSEQDAEEAVQDAFGKVWVHAAHFDVEKAAFGTWFYRILIHACYDKLRREPPKHADIDEMAEVLADGEETIEARAMGSQESVQVRKAVQLLPDRQRMAVVLSYFEEMTNPEAAAAMGIHVKALEGLLVRARRTLREVLGEGYRKAS